MVTVQNCLLYPTCQILGITIMKNFSSKCICKKYTTNAVNVKKNLFSQHIRLHWKTEWWYKLITCPAKTSLRYSYMSPRRLHKSPRQNNVLMQGVSTAMLVAVSERLQVILMMQWDTPKSVGGKGEATRSPGLLTQLCVCVCVVRLPEFREGSSPLNVRHLESRHLSRHCWRRASRQPTLERA